MKDGPLVRKRTHVTRLGQGGIPPLRVLSSPPSLFSSHRRESAPAALLSGHAPEPGCVRLGNWLPINLRRFLLAEFGPDLWIEGDAIHCLRPNSAERFMRELARAIRRFSYNRARELWVECMIDIARLEGELSRAVSTPDYPVLLCLRCERISAGTDAAKQHCTPRCLTLDLACAPQRCELQPAADPQALRRRLYQIIEDFRYTREVAGLPHFDLDYYIPNHHYVLTWRPLPPGDVK